MELGALEYVTIFGVVSAALFLFWILNKNKKVENPKITEIIKEKDSSKSETEKIRTEKIRLVSLEEALSNTRKGFWGRISSVLTNSQLDEKNFDQIEEILYTSDLGPKTVQKLIAKIQEKISTRSITLDNLKGLIRDEIKIFFKNNSKDLSKITSNDQKNRPEVWMIVGVNGAGKTTTIGKLAHKLASQNLNVMIAAGDTFRAAAREQLKVWADRSHVQFFSLENTDSPSGVAFEAVQQALKHNVDILIVDTAGRLHTQGPLMEELKKVKRVMDKALPGSPHEVLLVLDANSGQNALVQAKEFNDALGITGVIITKMDGTAKGGVAVGVASDLNLNIKLIGVGEKVEDLRPFEIDEFVDSII